MPSSNAATMSDNLVAPPNSPGCATLTAQTSHNENNATPSGKSVAACAPNCAPQNDATNSLPIGRLMHRKEVVLLLVLA